MFRSRTRKVLRDIWTRKGRTLLVSIAIFIGVLGVVTLISSGDLMIRQLKKDLQQDKLGMLRAFVTVPSGTSLDNAAYLQTLREVPGVTEVQGNVVSPISWKIPGEAEYRDGMIRTFSQPLDTVRLEPPRLLSGGRFPAPGSKEIAIELRMAEKYDLKVGDPIVLRILSSASETTTGEETWTISGILFHPYTFFGSNGFVPNDISLYANYEEASYIGGFTGYNSIYTRFTDYATTERESEQFLSAIGEKTPYIVVFSYKEDPKNNIFIRNTKQYASLINMLAIMAMIVSGFLVANVISAIVLEQNRQIGVMKSLGATRWDNFMIYSGIALTYGLIGLIPGVLLGIPLGYVLGKNMAAFANAMIEGFAISPLGIGVGIAMGMIVPVFAAFVPVYNGTKVTILQAMTDLGISTRYGKGYTARMIGALHLPINLRQALSTIVQKKGRLAMTVITLTLAVAAFMGVYAMFDSLNKVIGNIYDAYGYEIQVTPAELEDYTRIKGLILNASTEILDVYPGIGISLQVEGYKEPQFGSNQLGVSGLDPSTPTFKFDLKEGTGWKDDPNRPGIIITKSLADTLGKKLGDKLKVSVGGKPSELEIIGIDKFGFDAAWMEWHALANLGGLNANAPTPNEYNLPVQVAGYSGTMPDGQAVAIGFDASVGAFLTFKSGQYFTPSQPGIIISQEMAAKGGYKAGDTLTLSVAGNQQTYPITGIFSLPPQVAATGAPPDVIGMYWEQLAALEGRSTTGESSPSALYVHLKNADATSEEVEEIMKAISKNLLANGIAANYINQVKSAEDSAQQILSLGAIFNMTALIMAAVGAIGLLSTLSMSVFERQKEIGVMRSIGAGSGTIASQFLFEGILVGLIAWLVGVPLSYLLGLMLMKSLPFSFAKFTFPLAGLAIGLVGMLVIATIASLWPSISAARKTVSDILRYQ
jgi:putative ABC transport system permease protein